MKIIFHAKAFDEYMDWLHTDRALFKRITRLINDIRRDPFDGIGKPEPLRYNYAGFWSRRIDDEHRLIYEVEEDVINILQCRGHYSDR